MNKRQAKIEALEIAYRGVQGAIDSGGWRETPIGGIHSSQYAVEFSDAECAKIEQELNDLAQHLFERREKLLEAERKAAKLGIDLDAADLDRG